MNHQPDQCWSYQNTTLANILQMVTLTSWLKVAIVGKIDVLELGCRALLVISMQFWILVFSWIIGDWTTGRCIMRDNTGGGIEETKLRAISRRNLSTCVCFVYWCEYFYLFIFWGPLLLITSSTHYNRHNNIQFCRGSFTKTLYIFCF